MEKEEDKNKKRGLLTSIILHLMLILMFAFFGMSYTIPPPEEEGITINFGYVEAGSGEVQSSNPETSPQEQTEQQEEVEEVEEAVSQEEILEQSVEESASVTKKEEKKKEEEAKEEVPEPDKNLSDALNKWKNKKDQSTEGDGTTDQAGDQGSLDGDPNSKNYTGGGSGDGTSFNLSGRAMLSSPKIKDDSQDEGTVVVDIIVDKYGNVLRANPGARGSTTTSPILYKKAKEAAMSTKFNANPNAPEEQKGQMTFKFILN